MTEIVADVQDIVGRWELAVEESEMVTVGNEMSELLMRQAKDLSYLRERLAEAKRGPLEWEDDGRTYDLNKQPDLVRCLRTIRNGLLQYSWIQKTIEKAIIIIERQSNEHADILKTWLHKLLASSTLTVPQREAARLLLEVVPTDSLWQHRKTCGLYRYLLTGKAEWDSSFLSVYEKVGSNTRDIWIRPFDEFFDGRFMNVEM